MLKVLWNGRSGLRSNQNRLDVITNNINNVDTTGYKKNDLSFQDIMYEKLEKQGVPISSQNRGKLLQGSGSRAEKIVRDFKQGFISQTDSETDIAIEGKGFFRVKDSQGRYYYTRDGAFKIDGKGNFVHSSGRLLDIDKYNPSNLSFPISISEKGEIVNSKGELVGEINIYDFNDKDDIISLGDNLFQTNEKPIKANGILKQGFLEKSNVDIAKELTDMLITQRAFELNSRTVKSGDEMWQMANNLRNK
ncbi:MAG: flagellar hook-basal body complex protein [Caloramator sp.]|nr:flagellar hook-basal body complex protein [Caloramator sp.]